LQPDERAPSPDTLVLLTNPEKLGPTEDEENDFAKELAKMVTDASTESRKVDKRTAQVLWDTTTLAGLRKKKVETSDSEDGSGDATSDGHGTMKFMVLTRKGNKQQVG
jgi:regulator of nonsense transcripts 2